jgi:hypothetical protein
MLLFRRLLAYWHLGSSSSPASNHSDHLQVGLHDQKSIICKWVYMIKNQFDGSFERYKAHFIARGFQQEHSRDYDVTYALVAHMTTIHTLLVVAFVCQWSISQLDVKNFFLNDEL